MNNITTQQIMTDSYYLLGKRVELLYTSDQYTLLTPGDLGTIDYIDDFGTIFVKWDNASSLGLIPGVDKWKVIKD